MGPGPLIRLDLHIQAVIVAQDEEWAIFFFYRLDIDDCFLYHQLASY